jgi:hypothetical protein
MTSQELHDKMVAVLETLTIEHHKTAKAAHGRARKIAGELKKLSNRIPQGIYCRRQSEIKYNTMSNFDLRKYLAEGKLLKESKYTVKSCR